MSRIKWRLQLLLPCSDSFHYWKILRGLGNYSESGMIHKYSSTKYNDMAGPGDINNGLDLIERAKKYFTLPKELKDSKPEYGSLRGVLPRVYHPMDLGREAQKLGDDKHKPQEMHDGWRESGWNRGGMERLAESAVFENWVHAKDGGVHLILGEPGSGKSTLLAEWFERGNKFKTHVVKPTLWLDLGKTNIDIVALLPKLSNVLSSRNPLILLDSWDEATDELKKIVKDILPTLPGVIVITCRSAVYSGEFDEFLEHRKPYHVMGLQPNSQLAFLQDLAKIWQNSGSSDLKDLQFSQANDTWCHTLWQAIQGHPQIKRIAGSPLLLTLLAYTHPPPSVISTQLPDNKLAFYEKAFVWLCRNRIDKKCSVGVINDLKLFLVNVVMDKTFNDNLDEQGLLKVFDATIDKFHDPELSFELVEANIQKTGLLKKSTVSGVFSFLHKSFQEWLLATGLHQKEQLIGAIQKNWQDSRFQNTLALMWCLATEEERYYVSEYLIKQGCRKIHLGEDKFQYVSGLRTAILLWNSSGLMMGADALTLIMKHIGAGRLRKLVVAQHFETCGDILAKLTEEDDKEIRCAATSNPNMFCEHLAVLAHDNEPDVRRSVARNSNTSAVLLDVLSKDFDKEARLEVARNTNTPDVVLAMLAQDEDSGVREYLAKNVNTPEENLSILTKDIDNIVRGSVAENSKMTSAQLAVLAKDDEFYVRRGVAANTNIPDDILFLLARDGDHGVRESVARNTRTSGELLAILALDVHYMVRSTVATNDSTSSELLSDLAKDEFSYVRWSVAENKNLSGMLLAVLAKDTNENVRGAVASNENTSDELLSVLVKDAHSYVRFSAASNKNTPGEFLSMLAKDDKAVVRKFVGINAYTSGELLSVLAKDNENDVREFVARNVNTCLEWLGD